MAKGSLVSARTMLSGFVVVCVLFAVTPALGAVPSITGLESSTHIVDDFHFSDDAPSFEWDAANDLPELIGSFDTTGQAYSVAVSGDTVYVADLLEGLQIIDVSEPGTPTLRGAYDTPDFAYDVAISGTTAYVADFGAGLQIIDASDPDSPALFGSLDTTGSARNVAVSGSTVCVADDSEGLVIIDASEPGTPTVAGTYATPDRAFGVTICGSFAYVADYSSMQIIDISNPSSPSFVGEYDTSGFSVGIAVSGDKAYLANSASGIQIIDVSDPAAPALLSTFATQDNARKISISGDTAYVADFHSGLQVIDVSDPTVPAWIGTLDTNEARGLDVDGGTIYLADTVAGLKIVKVAEFVTVSLLDTLDSSYIGCGVAVQGDIVYLADWGDGVDIIDISNPSNMSLLGNYVTDDPVIDVVVAGDRAYVAVYEFGLQILDVSEPGTPTLLGSYETPAFAHGVAVSGDVAFVADGSSLQAIDVSDPTSPTLFGFEDTHTPMSVAVSGDTAYSLSAGGLHVIDVSDPNSMNKLSELAISGYGNDIAVSGDLAYVADRDDGLHVIDVSDPSKLSVLGTFYTAGEACGITVVGDVAYIAVKQAGIQVVDVSDPESPSSLGTYSTTDDAQDVVVSGDMAFIASNYQGLTAVDVADGPVGYSYVLDASNTTDPDASAETAETSADLSGVADGTWWFHVRAVGLRGEIGSTSHRRVMIDTTPPVTTSDAVADYVGSATITLAGDDGTGTSQVGFSYYKLNDAASWSMGTTVEVDTPGEHSLQFFSNDNAGNNETPKFVDFTVRSDHTDYTPVAGSNRYSTAIQTSNEAFEDGTADCVVIATGTNWPDALGGAALAAAKNGPILLTKPTALSSGILEEIDRLGASEAIILGGLGAISQDVEDALVAHFADENLVDRIGESNRYTTAQAIAAATIDELDAGAGYEGTAFVATGGNFPDALAASPLAAAKGWPIYLVKPGSNPPTAEMQARGVTDVLILGGTGAITDAQQTSLESAFPGNVERLDGKDRYATGVEVATYGVDTVGLTWDGLAFSTGQNFPDALAGGVLAGKNGSVMLLTKSTSLPTSVSDKLTTERDWIADVYYLGGDGAISQDVRDTVATILH